MLSLLTRNNSRRGLNFALQRFVRQVPTKAKQTSPIQYEKKTPLEHVLLRPGMYVGAVEWSSSMHYVPALEDSAMVKRSIELSPALLKLFDEILVNAADNHVRTGTTKTIKVQVTKTDDSLAVKVENDGGVIPIGFHEKEGLYIPELIFGHLLTGSNFNDADSRYTGGSHGYGAKLANIFSHSFNITVINSGQRYSQSWEHNMSICHPPVIDPVRTDEANSVCVSFTPDLSKLGMSPNLSTDDIKQRIQDIELLFKKRVYDIAGCLPDVSVVYNDQLLPIRSFEDYVRLYFQTVSSHDQTMSAQDQTVSVEDNETDSTPKIGFATSEETQWQVALSSSPSFECVSFVNNVWTPRGGTHVNFILSQITQYIEQLLSKDKLKATSNFIKDQLFLFISAKVENPSFDGQTKEFLLTKPSFFARYNKLTKDQLATLVLDTEIYNTIKNRVLQLEVLQLLSLTQKLKKNKSTITLDIPKLEDAHYAGTSRSEECTLILTEGDSAKALAVAGLSLPPSTSNSTLVGGSSKTKAKKNTVKNSKNVTSNTESTTLQPENTTLQPEITTSNSQESTAITPPVSREFFGVMPLRGKLLNVRSLTNHKQIANNEELINLIKALGLDFKQDYSLDKKGLRYGKVMIMTDQDHDGSHIKGLLINFFHHFWPSLLTSEGFLLQFITPIVKLRPRTGKTLKGEKNKENPENNLVFYSMSEFKLWQKENDLSQYHVKYYKGLGTSTSKEGQEYFKDFAKHRKMFVSSVQSETDDAIDLVFNKNRAVDRKNWLLHSYHAELDIDHRDGSVDYSQFVNNELIHFSFADNLRSIPSAVDGLKPSQRKVLYGCLKRNLARNDELKVVQLSGYIAEQTAYHHGEVSLHQTIVNMAQDFVGANNVPLLQPIGKGTMP